MTDKLDIVYGMCIHGNNIASCQECRGNLFTDDIDLLNMKADLCQCTENRQTTKINNVYVCTICNKPITK